MALRELFASFGFEWDRSKVEAADRGVTRLAENLRGVAAALTSGLVIEGVKRFAEQLDTFDDLSDQTGLATEQLQLFGYAAKVSGSSAEEMFASLNLLQKAMGRTADASKGPVLEALKDLGIKTQDAAKQPRKLADVLPEVFNNFGQLKSEAQQAQVATALFGRSGVKLLPTLRRGGEGLADLNAQLKEFGGPVSADTIAKAGEFRDNIVRLETAMFSLKGVLAASVFPQLSKIVVGLGHGIAKLSDWVKYTTLADSASIALAGTLGLTLAKSLAPYLGSGLKFAAIFLAFDDLIGFLEGQDSLIGAALDKAFGYGSADAVRAWVKDAYAQVKAWVPKAVAEFKAWTSAVGDDVAAWYRGFRSWVDQALETYRGFLAEGESATEAFVDTLSDPAFWEPILDGLIGAMSKIGEIIAQVIAYSIRASIRNVLAHPFDSLEAASSGAGAFVGKLGAAIGGNLGRNVNQGADETRKREFGTDYLDAGTLGDLAGRGARSRGAAARALARSKAAEQVSFVNPYLAPTAEAISSPLFATPAPTLPPGSYTTNNNRLEIHAPITVQVPPGSSAQVVKDAGAAAAAAVQNERRAAYEALTQRSPPK